MSTEYSERDSARAREAERSSAGYQTQPLVLPPGFSPPARTSRLNPIFGVLLIVLGCVMLIGYAIAGTSGIAALPLPSRGALQAGMIVLTVGSCFLFFALWRRLYPFLIPGCILAGLSVGIPFAALTHGVSILWSLSFAFFAILFTSRMLFQWRREMIWPVIPAVVLFGVGTIIAIANLPSFLLGGVVLLPLLLIVVGLALGRARQSP